MLTLGRFLLLDRSVSGSETAAEKRAPEPILSPSVGRRDASVRSASCPCAVRGRRAGARPPRPRTPMPRRRPGWVAVPLAASAPPSRPLALSPGCLRCPGRLRPAWRSHRPTRRWDRRHVRLAGGIAGAALAAVGTRRCRLPPARARLRALSVGCRSRPPVCVLGWPCPQHRQRTGGRHAPAFPSGSRPAGRRFTSATRAAPPAPLASTSAPRRRRVTVTLSPCALPHVLPERHHGTGCSQPPAGALHGVRTAQAPPSPGFPGGTIQPSGHRPGAARSARRGGHVHVHPLHPTFSAASSSLGLAFSP